ncbi:MAG: acyl-CoA dehydrogenase family protein, partial [Dehalococcoidia bacterium]
MDSLLTEEQQLLRKTVRDFATQELEPIAQRIDEREEFPWESMKKLAKLGLTGIGIDPKYGGSGGDEVQLAIAVEEIARACASTSAV